MKALSAFLLGATLLTGAAHAKGPNMVFIAPGLGHERCIAQLEPIVNQFTQTAVRGDRLPIHDGNTMLEIAVFSAPDSKLYDKPAPQRLQRTNADQAKMLIAFCKQSTAQEPSLNFTEGLRFGGNNRPAPGSVNYLFIGPPKVIDPKALDVAMRGGLVPEDGHLLVTRDESIYGAKGESKLLSGIRVHFAVSGDDWSVSAAHKESVERFAAHSVAQRGGDFRSFEDDINTVLKRIETGAQNRLSYRPLSFTDHKLAMVDYSAPRASNVNIFERDLTLEPLAKADLETPLDNVSIGISWTCMCDADLLVTPRADAPPLYWNNTATADGRFLKDYRTANARHGFETVVLTRPVKLSELMIAVNLYSGDVPEGLSGKIRIAVDDRTFESPFRVPASNGNRAKGINHIIQWRGAPNEHWTLIDPAVVTLGGQEG